MLDRRRVTENMALNRISKNKKFTEVTLDRWDNALMIMVLTCFSLGIVSLIFVSKSLDK